MSYGINLGPAISLTDAMLQQEMYNKFHEAEARNQQLGQITTLLQKINKHQKDGKLDIKDHPEVVQLLQSIREFAPDLLEKDVTHWDAEELDRFKQNINHEIKKMESDQKMMMDLAIHRMGEHKNIYDALLETCKRLGQMGDNYVRNQRS